MDDYKIILYIIAAVIYFLTRSKKKPAQGTGKTSRPGTENNPSPQAPTKTFEELLKEITGEPEPEEQPEARIPEPRPIEEKKEDEAEKRRLEGERRAFADDESRRVYEESIKRAERFDHDQPSEQMNEPRIFKGQTEEEEEEYTFADELRDGLSTEEAKKAIIYAEIFNRKY